VVYHRSNSPLVRAFHAPERHHMFLHLFHHQHHAVMLHFAFQSAESALNHQDAVYLDQ